MEIIDNVTTSSMSSKTGKQEEALVP